MLIAFPMKFKLVREAFIPIVTIAMSGKKGTEEIAVYQCFTFAEIAKKYGGLPMETNTPLKPEPGEDFTSSIRLIFKADKNLDEFVRYLQTNLTIGGSWRRLFIVLLKIH